MFLVRSLLFSSPPAVLVTFIYFIGRTVYLGFAYNRHKPINWMNEIIRILFVAYIMLVLSVTLIPQIFGMDGHYYWLRLRQDINLIPLISIIRAVRSIGTAYSGDSLFMIELIVRNVGGNVLLFMPLGFLAPLCWARFRAFSRIFILGLLTSVTIECLQLIELLTNVGDRIVHIDDVICNTLGAVFGYIIYRVMVQVIHALQAKADRQEKQKSAE